ncbi:DNApol-eta [Drosophila santomea]|uniref:DNApol-eta n=1 Tax=Drosophila santomea TaxID=129105 RepID=UPI001952E5AC|nr:DNApol-eta [Drosophila santomea]
MASARIHVSMQSKYDRVVLLVDMDCFFCQVEEKQHPEYRNRPLAVVQYNPWRGGGIIAVNYAARAKGVTRHMRGDEAKDLCPEIVLCQVPNIREKADTSKYRDAGKEVANVLQRFTKLLERASVDEAYLDITETVNHRMQQMQSGAFALQPQELVNTFAVGYPNIGDFVNKITNRFANPYMDDERFQMSYDQNDLPAVRQSDIRLLIGASVAGEVRAAVKKETGYECSAGIAHNKILAKLAAGMNKPNKQTILPLAETASFFDSLPVGKIKGLGGKFGEVVCETLGIKFMGQVVKFTEVELQRKFDEKNGTWLFNISRGIDMEAVTPRFYSKSIGCCKKFPGRNNITGLKTLQHWLGELSSEINDRLEKDFIENNRRAKQMVVQYVQDIDGEEVASSRSTALKDYDQESIVRFSLDLIRANTKTFLRPGSESALNNAIKFLGISVGKFETVSSAQNKLQEMFANQAAKKRRISAEEPVQPPKVHMEKKPKQTEEFKMKSFFANYLQGAKKEDAKPDGFSVDPQAAAPAEATSKNSFKEDYKQKLHVTARTEAVDEETVLTSTPPEFKKSFFSQYLKQQKSNQGSSISGEDSLDVQGLAEELDAIEAGNSKDFDEDTEEETDTTSDIQMSKSEGLPLDVVQKKNQNTLNDSTGNEVCTKTGIKHSAQLELLPLTEDELKPSTSKRKFDEIENSGSNYKESYVEFAVPNLRTDLLPTIKCDQCGANIPDEAKSLQTHRDHHFAQELSRTLRSNEREERMQSLKKVSLKPTPLKKSKKTAGSGSISNNTAPLTNSITKFFSAKPTQEQASSDPHMQQCTECKAFIKSVDMPEHLDYHVAKNLQRKLNQQDLRTRNAALSKEKTSPAQPKKQSQKKLNSTISASSSGSKTIAQFFSQSN